MCNIEREDEEGSGVSHRLGCEDKETVKKQSAKETRSRIGGRKRKFLRLTHKVLGQKKRWIMVLYTYVFKTIVSI